MKKILIWIIFWLFLFNTSAFAWGTLSYDFWTSETLTSSSTRSTYVHNSFSWSTLYEVSRYSAGAWFRLYKYDFATDTTTNPCSQVWGSVPFYRLDWGAYMEGADIYLPFNTNNSPQTNILYKINVNTCTLTSVKNFSTDSQYTGWNILSNWTGGIYKASLWDLRAYNVSSLSSVSLYNYWSDTDFQNSSIYFNQDTKKLFYSNKISDLSTFLVTGNTGDISTTTLTGMDYLNLEHKVIYWNERYIIYEYNSATKLYYIYDYDTDTLYDTFTYNYTTTTNWKFNSHTVASLWISSGVFKYSWNYYTTFNKTSFDWLLWNYNLTSEFSSDLWIDFINISWELPDPLEITGTWSITTTWTWIIINWFSSNLSTEIDYILTKYNPTPLANTAYTGSLWTFSGGTLSLNIENEFVNLGNYIITLNFNDINYPPDKITEFLSFDYSYNAWYEQQNPADFSFFTSGYSFFENGFALHNFIPDPYGWKIKFEILQPNWTGTTSVITRDFWPYETDWLGYGFNSAVKVTYPYHPIAWTYQVRPIYTINWIEVYPFWSDYNSYEITNAEIDYVWWVEAVDVVWDDCDADNDGDIWTLEFTQCWVEKVKTGVNWIWSLIKEIINLWNVEGGENIMSFLIPTANANELVDGFNAWLKPGPLQPIVDYMKYGALFILLLMTLLILVILISNNKKS